MEAKELRIGNFINYEATTHFIESVNRWTITHRWIENDDDLYECPLSNIKPIQLNEFWLEEFGFTHCINDNWHVWYLHGVEVATMDHNNYEITDTGFYFKDVHWLQNYYYFLTGEELSIDAK